MKRKILTISVLGAVMSAQAQIQTNAGVQYLQAMQKDVSTDFYDLSNTYFLADSLAAFDVAKGEGKVQWKRYRMSPRQAFNLNGYWPVRMQMLDFPDAAYDNDPELQVKLDFITPRTLRIRMLTTPTVPRLQDADDPMFCDAFKTRPAAAPWRSQSNAATVVYQSPYGSVEIQRFPFRLVLKDAKGRILTQTRHIVDNDSSQVKLLPLSFIKRGSDNSRSTNPVLTLAPGERIYGCGESFTSLNKVGQKVHLSVTDPQGPETDGQYKPVPFYFSNRGYGVFMHTSAPVTADFGASYIGAQRLFMADEQIDLFVFFGEPKDILNEYTNITGKSPMLPLWSFGTWMSRITYFSQQEGLDIAKQLRAHKIPSDVIHFDTGWFGVDWQCDYEFAKERFSDPVGMLKQLADDGFHTCLWQLPYFTPKNRFFPEIIDKRLHVVNATGGMPVEDAILDFSNPETVSWYQSKIEGLMRQGVSTIKCDFGEAAPYNGFYHSGKGGLYEHNLYPLRYNKALWEVVERNHPGEGIIWARSAWAGSQRYALHWGGDAATTNTGMLGDLRGGLSFGLSGFSFWSHDMGGFVTASPEDIYRRWLPFGFLSSHTRAHGAPPTEPWLISESFTDAFRACAEMKYRLMPYVYAQAKDCSERGLPMVRALLVEFPDDQGAWLVEDEYMFGSQMLVAPLMESGTGRDVYLPRGKWIDYQTGAVYQGGYQHIEAGPIPAVILVRDGSLIPHVPLAQRTDQIDWDAIEYRSYSADSVVCSGLLFKPGDAKLQVVEQPAKASAAAADFGKPVTWDRHSLMIDGRRVCPVMGEVHYSRIPADEWQREVRRMKEGGVTVVATYVFWNHVEEQEGRFRWDGQRDLRRFLEICKQEGLPVVLRIGPFCHGEVRNGGIPDWMFSKGCKLRSQDKTFLSYAEKLYRQIYSQIIGLQWKDGGPLIACQFDNEYRGSGDYLMALKKMALQIGFDLPFYTRTGWPELSKPVPFGEMLPLYGDYADGFWDKETGECVGNYYKAFNFKGFRSSTAIGTDLLGKQEEKVNKGDEQYPYFTCELGGGMATAYHRRPYIYTDDTYSMALVKLGSGSNLLGYYMYHGGTNPESTTGITMNETQRTLGTANNDLPQLTYDFQAPLGEFGQTYPQYYRLRPLHLFMHDYGELLAPMEASFPAKQDLKKGEDSGLRWSVRSASSSTEAGPESAAFIFVNNYERLQNLSPKTGVELSACGVALPSLTIPAGCMAIFPVNIDGIRYATAQLVAKREGKIFLMQVKDVPTTICMADGKTLRNVKPRGTSKPVYKNVYLLSQQEAEHLYLPQSLPTTASQVVACNKVKEAGPLRTIVKGKAKVAEAPSEADWQQAAVYKLTVPKQTDAAAYRLLSIDYQGDCARLYAGGRLIADNFQYGRPFLYGLWRLPADVTELELHILPWQTDAPVYLPREADNTPGERVKKVVIINRD